MRKFFVLVLSVFVGCASGVRKEEVVALKKDLEVCQKRVSAIEERQFLIEAKLDEALSKWDVFEKAVKNIKAYKEKEIVIERESPELSLYKKAYKYWYAKRYKRAIPLFHKFILSFDDKFLTPQAYLLLVDSYEKIRMKRRACLVLKAFFDKFNEDNIFYCAAYKRLKTLKCKFKLKKSYECER